MRAALRIEKCDENVGGLGCWWQKSSLVLLGGHRLEIAAVAAVEEWLELKYGENGARPAIS